MHDSDAKVNNPSSSAEELDELFMREAIRLAREAEAIDEDH